MAKTLKGKRLTIAIDGPSGAGKSTVARSLAKRLGYLYIDTGAMYRSVALRVKEKGISPEDELALNQLASSLHITFVTEGEETHVFCDGEDVTEAIRIPEISRLASDISKQKGCERSPGSDAEGDGKREAGWSWREEILERWFFLMRMLNFIWMPRVRKG